MRRAFTLVELLVSVAIMVALLALLMPAVQAAREAARRSACQYNLHQSYISMVQRMDAKGRLPAQFCRSGEELWCPTFLQAYHTGEEELGDQTCYLSDHGGKTRERVMDDLQLPPERIVLVWEIEAVHNHTRNVLFLSGHVASSD